jgi:hypothetical protein
VFYFDGIHEEFEVQLSLKKKQEKPQPCLLELLSTVPLNVRIQMEIKMLRV